MKPFGYNEGDRAEILGMYFLASVGFCSPVPRQFDHFGIDLFVHLFERQRRNVAATGTTISAQVKSNCLPIVVEKEDQLQCLHNLNVPHFVVVVDRAKARLKIYTTYRRIECYWENRSKPVQLLFDLANRDTFHEPDHLPLLLGHPIVDYDFDAIEQSADSKATVDNIAKVLAFWARWDQIHIGYKAGGLPIVVVPKVDEANVVPDLNHTNTEIRGYPNKDSLDLGIATFVTNVIGTKEWLTTLLNPVVGLGHEEQETAKLYLSITENALKQAGLSATEQ